MSPPPCGRRPDAGRAGRGCAGTPSAPRPARARVRPASTVRTASRPWCSSSSVRWPKPRTIPSGSSPARTWYRSDRRPTVTPRPASSVTTGSTVWRGNSSAALAPRGPRTSRAGRPTGASAARTSSRRRTWSRDARLTCWAIVLSPSSRANAACAVPPSRPSSPPATRATSGTSGRGSTRYANPGGARPSPSVPARTTRPLARSSSDGSGLSPAPVCSVQMSTRYPPVRCAHAASIRRRGCDSTAPNGWLPSANTTAARTPSAPSSRSTRAPSVSTGSAWVVHPACRAAHTGYSGAGCSTATAAAPASRCPISCPIASNRNQQACRSPTATTTSRASTRSPRVRCRCSATASRRAADPSGAASPFGGR